MFNSINNELIEEEMKLYINCEGEYERVGEERVKYLNNCLDEFLKEKGNSKCKKIDFNVYKNTGNKELIISTEEKEIVELITANLVILKLFGYKKEIRELLKK